MVGHFESVSGDGYYSNFVLFDTFSSHYTEALSIERENLLYHAKI